MRDVRRRVPVLSRRSFLRYTAAGAGLVALSRLRAAPLWALPPPPASGWYVLTRREAEIFAVIAERMVHTGDPAMPALRDTDAIHTIDRALVQLDADVQTQLRWLLRIFQWGPPLFQFKWTTFSHMSIAERDAYIRNWETSELETRRLAFRALRNLSMLGYYSQDQTWKGIHYDGPWVPRARSVVTPARES